MGVYIFQKDKIPFIKNAVITIGSFDGVHFGHRKILKEVVDAASKNEGESVLITFDPHPRKIIQPNIPLGLLTSPNEKYELILKLGIHHIVVVPFTRDFSMLSAEDYVRNFLIRQFNPCKIVIGYDHRFGHSREGNINLLKKMVDSNVKIQEISAQLIDDASISSTKVRNALLEGEVELAAEMLGRNYLLEGTVVHGQKLGRKLGYPTANIHPNDVDKLIPGIGIYAVKVKVEGQKYYGMLSIGKRPTVTDSQEIAIEVNIFDFDNNIYGVNLELEFIKYLRPELKFGSLEELIIQLAQDERDTRAVFNI